MKRPSRSRSVRKSSVIKERSSTRFTTTSKSATARTTVVSTCGSSCVWIWTWRSAHLYPVQKGMFSQKDRITTCNSFLTKTLQHIKNAFVNIYEYVQASKADTKAPRYESWKDFVKTIRKTGPYPLKATKNDEFLKAMLRFIFHSPEDTRG